MSCSVDFMFSVKCEKVTCAMRFLCSIILNARVILTSMLETILKTSNALFHEKFSPLKVGNDLNIDFLSI